MFPTRPSDPKLETLKKELSSNPDILSVTRAGILSPMKVRGTVLPGQEKRKVMMFIFTRLVLIVDYAKTYKLETKGGTFLFF